MNATEELPKITKHIPLKTPKKDQSKRNSKHTMKQIQSNCSKGFFLFFIQWMSVGPSLHSFFTLCYGLIGMILCLVVGHLTRKSGVLGSIPGLATYFRFSFRFFKKGSCQLLAEVCARSTG